MKNIIAGMGGILAALLFVVPAFAHVVVKPSQAGIGSVQTFTVSVPNEKDTPTTALRLMIPQGLKSVSPNVKTGWTIEMKKSGEGDNATVTEIDWTGGSIPPEQRDDFVFSAQVPSSEETINWKVYQTYQDGTVISWDQNPDSMKNLSDDQKEANEKKGIGPYSQTKIVNDLTSNTSSEKSTPSNGASQNSLTLFISVIALLGAGYSLWLQLQKK